MRWIVRLIGLLLVFVVVAGVSILFLPADRIARLAAEQMRTVTGRDVSISGDVSLSIWPVLGASVGGLEVGNPDWTDKGPMLTAQNAAIGIDAAALLSGTIRIKNIEATSPTIRLESRQDGRASWQFTDASGEAQIETTTDPNREAQAFSIDQLTVTNATLIYDAEGSDLVRYDNVDLALKWPERLGPADITARLTPASEVVTVEATIDAFAGFIAGQVQPVRARVQAGGGEVAVNGRANTAGEVAASIETKLPDTDAFMRALGLPAPGLPVGLGRTLNMSTELTLTSDRRLSLRDMRADLGRNTLSGAADLSLNGKPTINAQFDAGNFDLSSLTETGGSSGGATGSGWPKDPIDASGLAAFDGQIALTANSVDLGTFKLGPTRTLLTNDRSRMVFSLKDVRAYEGRVTGEFVVNNRSGLSVGGKINADAIAVQPLLSDAADIDRLTGQADLRLSFLGVGQTVDSIMRSLSGDGNFAIGQGTILGIDLDRLMSTGSGSGGTTIFDSLTASFTMTGGDLFNEDLLLALRSFEARGAGRVGLGAQDLDYLFTPVALKLNDGQGLAIPVRIKGPWSGPRILPDLEAALDLNLEAEKERLKDEAEDKLKQKLAEELNLNPDADQSLEDAANQKIAEELNLAPKDNQNIEDAAKSAIENKIQDELKNGLRKLFD